MIMVHSTFHLLPETRDDALRLMKNMVRLCRQEHGCLAYEYYEGLTDPNQVILLQEWESADYLQEHYQTDHMEDFLGKLGNYLQSPVATRSFASQEEQEERAERKEQSSSSRNSEELPKPGQTIH